MKQLYADLWQTPAVSPATGLTFHAYLLTRPEGNVLFGHPRSTEDFPKIDELGGISTHYLTHSHEVHSSLTTWTEHFASTLCCHANVEPYMTDLKLPVTFLSPTEREFHSGDIEVLNTPGHTNNNLCFKFSSPHGRTYLFVGDTIYLDRGKWKYLVVGSDGGDEKVLSKTLFELKDEDIDVVATSVSMGQPMTVPEVDRETWRSILDGVLRQF